MPPDPQPDETRIARIRKILKDYPDRIAAIEIPSPNPLPKAAPGAEKEDSIAAVLEKLAAFERGINSEIRKENDVFQKIEKKINSELAGMPARQFVRTDAPDTPAETGQSPGKQPEQRCDPSPIPLIERLFSAPVFQPGTYPAESGALNSHAGGGETPAVEPVRQKLSGRPDQSGAVNNMGRLSWVRWSAIIILVLVGILFSLTARPFVIRRFKAPVPPGASARTNPPVISGTVAPPAVPEKQKKISVLALSAAHPVGLAGYDNRWLSVDWMDGRIFELNPAVGLKFLQAFPNSFTTGLSAGNSCLWSTDAFNRRCYKHDPRTFAVLASFPTPGPSPSAVYWDGASLWLTDKETRRAYKYLNIQGDATALIHYQLLEAEPVGLWRRDDLLWVLDRAGKSVRRYRVDKELIPVDMLDISGWLTGKARPVGLALSGSEIWILTENPGLLYILDLNQVKWVESRRKP